MKNDVKNAFSIVEVDDEGWAAFKVMEAEQRREYAASLQAVVDHEAWVNAPEGSDHDWCYVQAGERDAIALPSSTQLPWESLHDWALERDGKSK